MKTIWKNTFRVLGSIVGMIFGSSIVTLGYFFYLDEIIHDYVDDNTIAIVGITFFISGGLSLILNALWSAFTYPTYTYKNFNLGGLATALAWFIPVINSIAAGLICARTSQQNTRFTIIPYTIIAVSIVHFLFYVFFVGFFIYDESQIYKSSTYREDTGKMIINSIYTVGISIIIFFVANLLYIIKPSSKNLHQDIDAIGEWLED